jgi:hypothetical protein
MKGLSFSVRNLHFEVAMAHAVVPAISKLPQAHDMEFKWKIEPMLEEHTFSMPNITEKEYKAAKYLTRKKDIGISEALATAHWWMNPNTRIS